MREITEHMIDSTNQQLQVIANDEPDTGMASCCYHVTGFTLENSGTAGELVLMFQNGPVNKAGVGVNGITHDMLIAIVLDRLRSFQSGRLACRENALAITKLEEALHWLNHRTQGRMRRGVEGKRDV